MRTAVIDVGSNSIKLLVADRGPGGEVEEVLSRTLEVRIGTGIGSGFPRLTREGIDHGLAAITALQTEAKALMADRFVAVATSAVRDASNGQEFRDKVRRETGLDLRILSGIEEANGIGRGLMTDPCLSDLSDFYLYDLGGGSLECLSFVGRSVAHAVSLPLGCVRLTEMFVARPQDPFGPDEAAALTRHIRSVLFESKFPFPENDTSFVVGTGGTLTTVRAILAAAKGSAFAQSESKVKVSEIQTILDQVGPLSVSERKGVPGLPASRADVFPVALTTLLVLANLGRVRVFQHSLRNLRWGLAAQQLE